jgi:hypothetical protein
MSRRKLKLKYFLLIDGPLRCSTRTAVFHIIKSFVFLIIGELARIVTKMQPWTNKNRNVVSIQKGVGTSKIRTSKGQNVESFFKDDQNVERSERQKFEKDQNVESQIRLSTF